MKTRRVTMAIHDLGCGGGGSLTVERTLVHLAGVVQAYVNPATEMAYIEYDPAVVAPDTLMAAVAELGFRPGRPSER